MPSTRRSVAGQDSRCRSRGVRLAVIAAIVGGVSDCTAWLAFGTSSRAAFDVRQPGRIQRHLPGVQRNAFVRVINPPKEGEREIVTGLKGEPIVVANVNGTFYAADAICPHLNVPMKKGKIEMGPKGPTITCSFHGSCFSLESGKCNKWVTGVLGMENKEAAGVMRNIGNKAGPIKTYKIKDPGDGYLWVETADLPPKVVPDVIAPRDRLVQAWGSLGVVAYLSFGVVKVIPIVQNGLGEITEDWQYGLLAAVLLFFAYVEGYKGFQQGFSPRVVSRGWVVAEETEQVPLWHKVLAPAFCIGYFHGTTKRVITSWAVTIVIFLVVVGVKQLDNPYRAIIDAGVIVGLMWGIVSIIVMTIQQFQTEDANEFDPSLPEDTQYYWPEPKTEVPVK